MPAQEIQKASDADKRRKERRYAYAPQKMQSNSDSISREAREDRDSEPSNHGEQILDPRGKALFNHSIIAPQIFARQREAARESK